MTYNVFGGTLSLNQSIKLCIDHFYCFYQILGRLKMYSAPVQTKNEEKGFMKYKSRNFKQLCVKWL